VLVLTRCVSAANIKDSYIRSLVEQNILMRSRIFAGSYFSTWSQFISHVRSPLSAVLSLWLMVTVVVWVQWWDHNRFKNRADNIWLEHVLSNANKVVTTHNNGDDYVYRLLHSLPLCRLTVLLAE